jgi:hypothetical protein
MKILRALKKSLILPKYEKLDYAEECLEGKNSVFEEKLAAVNMGFYPFQSKETILEKVRSSKIDLEQEYPELA